MFERSVATLVTVIKIELTVVIAPQLSAIEPLRAAVFAVIVPAIALLAIFNSTVTALHGPAIAVGEVELAFAAATEITAIITLRPTVVVAKIVAVTLLAGIDAVIAASIGSLLATRNVQRTGTTIAGELPTVETL
jgi:hypothetical protein